MFRTHHREKTDLPQNRARNHLFPHSVLEGRSKKAGLGSSSKPIGFSQILKQKRGSQPLGHLKWPGVGPNELICGSGGPLKATFWPITFPGVQFHCPTFLPLHFFANPQLPPKNRSSVRNAGKVVRSTAKATPGAGWFLAETGPRKPTYMQGYQNSPMGPWHIKLNGFSSTLMGMRG